MTDEEWGAIERPYRQAIIEHSKGNVDMTTKSRRTLTLSDATYNAIRELSQTEDRSISWLYNHAAEVLVELTKQQKAQDERQAAE